MAGACLLTGCSAAGDRASPPVDGHLFTRLPSTYTGVRFENRLTDTRDLHVFTYRNYYNGGGVALGDLTAVVVVAIGEDVQVATTTTAVRSPRATPPPL